MTRKEVGRLVNDAIDKVVEFETDLLDLDVSERALSHQLARYMAEQIGSPWSVDCEYNRHFNDPKRLVLRPRGASDQDVKAVTVFPDIIIHERNSDRNNRRGRVRLR